ncbi:hypothetical protein OH77DRAFT_1157305 [Trametes cingulata]|nr:hypothetical protein OH77DRAFT_1157305 [Trametes cingulata]
MPVYHCTAHASEAEGLDGTSLPLRSRTRPAPNVWEYTSDTGLRRLQGLPLISVHPSIPLHCACVGELYTTADYHPQPTSRTQLRGIAANSNAAHFEGQASAPRTCGASRAPFVPPRPAQRTLSVEVEARGLPIALGILHDALRRPSRTGPSLRLPDHAPSVPNGTLSEASRHSCLPKVRSPAQNALHDCSTSR